MKLLKYQDLTSVRAVRVVTLPRDPDPLALSVRALPPTFPQEAEREIPTPQAPWKGEFARNRRGQVEQDKHGRPIKVYEDQDPTYRQALDEAQQLQSIKMVVDALDPAEVQFAASKDSDPKAYYRAVRQELADFGFSIGDLTTLLKAVSEVSNISEEDLKVVREDFFGADPSPKPTSSAG